MLDIIRHAHSGWRYIIILLALITGLRLLFGMVARKKWLVWDRRFMVFYAVSMDIQVLMGGILLLAQSLWRVHIYLEHAATMIIALIIAHVGAKRCAKGSDDHAKFMTAFIFFIISAAFLALGIWRITAARG